MLDHSHYIQDDACKCFVFELFPPSLPACCIAKQISSTQSSAFPSLHIQIYPSALGKKSALRAFPTPLSALLMLPAFFFVGRVSSLDALVHLKPKGPGKICRGTSYPHSRMQSQRSTFHPLSKKHPPICCIFDQTLQPHYPEHIQGH